MTPTLNTEGRSFFLPGKEKVMEQVCGMAALWIGLALITTLLSIWFRIATALSEIVVGHPAEQIVRYAKENDIDQLIMGQKGKSKIESWLLGSVSKRVSTYSPCTVTIVK
jgi:nucleotide-binding universal stress UspA family protein